MGVTKDETFSSKNDQKTFHTLPDIGIFIIETEDYGFSNQAFDDTSSSSSNSTSIYLDNPQQNGVPIKRIPIKHHTSFWGTIFHMIFLSAGCPVLLIPGAFANVGLLYGSITMVIVFVIYVYKMRTLLRAATEMCALKQVSCMSYSDLVFAAFDSGPNFVQPLASAAKLFMNLVFILEWYGSCILICFLMAHNLQTICSHWLALNLSIQTVVLCMFIPLVALNLIRRLKFLEPCSIMGFAFTLVAVFLVLYYSVTDETWAKTYEPASLANISTYMGVLFTNINVTGAIISLKYEMKHPEKFESRIGVLTISYSIIFTMYFVLGVYFYFKYGTAVPQNSTDIIPENMLLSLCTLVSNILGLYLSFPLTLYVPLDIIWKDLLGKRKKLISYKIIWEYLLRIFMVTIIASVAYINLDLTFIVSLFGTVFSCIDSILTPAVIQCLVDWKLRERGLRSLAIMAKNFIFFIFGLLVMWVGIMSCL